MNGMKELIRVVALDIQGTLVSNGVSQLPRPGLRAFLEHCLRFERVALYTTLSAEQSERVLRALCGYGDAPPELLERWEHVAWSGAVKDLRFIAGVEPSQCVLVDNKPERVAPGQEAHVIIVSTFSGREEDDRELERVTDLLRARSRPSAERRVPRVIALDLEGTLVSNAVSQIPRPGLLGFSRFCHERFERVAIFTAVGRERAAAIIELLAREGTIAAELAARWEYVEWSGPTKDLRFIAGVEPSECLLVDDRAEYVHPGQESRWIRVAEFTGREDDDRELVRIEEELRAVLGE